MKGLKAGLLCLCLWCCACTDRESVPSGIIKPDSMKVILVDVITADHFASEFVMRDTLRKDSAHRDVKQYTRQLYETVFKLHHITRDEFNTSLDFYNSRPDLLKKMFDSLSAAENRRRNELYKSKTSPHSPLAGDSSKFRPHLPRKDSLPAPPALRHRDSLAAARHLMLKQQPGIPPRLVPRDSAKKIAHPLRKDSVNSVGHH